MRALSGDEVHKMADSYVQAARRVIAAGFDAVQLHTAHSWLMSAFLSPATNRREDEWGGSPEKRARFATRIAAGIRALAGPDYPLFVKLGLQDYHPEGKSLGEGLESAGRLIAAGVNAVEISEGLEGQPFHHIQLDATNPYYLAECREARDRLSVPLILVGGMRTLADMRAVVENGLADAVSLCRPFIMDPHLVRSLRAGTTDRSACTSCNLCLRHQVMKGGLVCQIL